MCTKETTVREGFGPAGHIPFAIVRPLSTLVGLHTLDLSGSCGRRGLFQRSSACIARTT